MEGIVEGTVLTTPEYVALVMETGEVEPEARGSAVGTDGGFSLLVDEENGFLNASARNLEEGISSWPFRGILPVLIEIARLIDDKIGGDRGVESDILTFSCVGRRCNAGRSGKSLECNISQMFGHSRKEPFDDG